MNRIEATAIARAAKAKKEGSPEFRFWRKVKIMGEDECWPWMAAERKPGEGYGAFWLEGRHHPSNRMALIFSGVEIPEGMVACHSCDNPGCCNPSHLFVGTPIENNNDKVLKKRHSFGETHGKSKLTHKQVCEIRSHKPLGVKRVQNGLTERLATEYVVTKQYISELFSRGWGKK